jgi:hypothetical protein
VIPLDVTSMPEMRFYHGEESGAEREIHDEWPMAS